MILFQHTDYPDGSVIGMKAKCLSVVIALFIATLTFAQMDGEIPQKHPVATEVYTKLAQERWMNLQAAWAVAEKAIGMADRSEANRLCEAQCMAVGGICDAASREQPPADCVAFHQALVECAVEVLNTLNLAGAPNPSYFREFLDKSRAQVRLLGQKVVALSAVVGGGLKPLGLAPAVPQPPAAPSWHKVPIEQWGDDERADESFPDPDGRLLSRVKAEVVQMNREWQAGLDAGKTVDWPHYFRWANRLWYECNIYRESPAREPLRLQAREAVIAVYDAMTRASQTGEKQTPERNAANAQVTALMAAMLGQGL